MRTTIPSPEVKDLPDRFCGVCGSPLEPKGRAKLDHYEKPNGIPIHTLVYGCPKKRWWNTHTQDILVNYGRKWQIGRPVDIE